MKIRIINSKIKPKCKIVLGVIGILVLYFALYIVTAYMRKYPINVTSAQGTTQNTLYITWRTNDPLGQSICSSNYTCKNIQNCCHEKWWM